MSNQFRRESAKIYQFPRKISGSGVGNLRIGKQESDLRAPRVVIVESGSGWYHEAAVQAERARKR